LNTKINNTYLSIFCDSEQALIKAYKDGLSQQSIVRTSSPALYMSGRENIQHLESVLTKSMIDDFRKAALPLAKNIYQCLKSDSELCEFALTAARIVKKWHSMSYKALALTDDDINKPCLVLNVLSEEKSLDNRLNPPWNYFLKNNNQCEFIEYSVTTPRTEFTKAPSLLSRIRMMNNSRIGYQIYLLVNKVFEFKNKRHAFIISTNDSLEEIAFLFASNGVSIKKLENIKIPKDMHESTDSIHHAVIEKITGIIQEFTDSWMIDDVKSGAIDLFNDYLYEALNRQLHGKDLWNELLENNLIKLGDMIFSNYPGAPEYIALAECCYDKKIGFIAFQHGVTREICSTLEINSVGYENGVASYFFTYSKIASEISNQSLFAKGKCIVGGLPKSYIQKPSNKLFTKNKILYVSTNCYAGNVNLRGGTANDVERAHNELSIVNDVLSVLPHNIVYKSYPSRPRYSEEDPVLASARNKKNISTFESSKDLRYLISKYRLIVTARATSTIGWCIMSGRPIVMIDYPDHMPLKEEARDLFDDGIFLFNAGSHDFLNDLKAFLEQPFDVIEQLWLDKETSRQKLINRYFSVFESNAGLNIEHFLSEMDAETKVA
jgi:hypothetical protein